MGESESDHDHQSSYRNRNDVFIRRTTHSTGSWMSCFEVAYDAWQRLLFES